MSKNKILIIDDDVDLLASTKLILESHNYVVSTASNTKLGAEVLKNFMPDLIILDIMMNSDLEGYNFLHFLKSDEKLKNIPVIMYSGMSKALGVNMVSAIEENKLLQNAVFIDKSNDWNILLEEIKKML
jgi:DNA-binding response OmpR family regulator